jgi:hypothetical protein
MSMMPSGGFRRIDRRLIHQTAQKVHPQNPDRWQLGPVSQCQFANSMVGAGREKQKVDPPTCRPPRKIRLRLRRYKHTSLTFLTKLSEKGRKRPRRSPVDRQGEGFSLRFGLRTPSNPPLAECSYPFSDSFVGAFSEVRGHELLRIIDNARRAAPWPPNPAKAPPWAKSARDVGWRPSENPSQRSSCSARRSLAKWSSLDCPKQKRTKRRGRCSHGSRTGGLESRLGCWSAGRS